MKIFLLLLLSSISAMASSKTSINFVIEKAPCQQVLTTAKNKLNQLSVDQKLNPNQLHAQVNWVKGYWSRIQNDLNIPSKSTGMPSAETPYYHPSICKISLKSQSANWTIKKVNHAKISGSQYQEKCLALSNALIKNPAVVLTGFTTGGAFSKFCQITSIQVTKTK